MAAATLSDEAVLGFLAVDRHGGDLFEARHSHLSLRLRMARSLAMRTWLSAST